MNVTANAISSTAAKPETGIKVQETAVGTGSDNITKLSELKQAVPSSDSTRPDETRASDQKSEGTDSQTQTKLTREDVQEMVEALEDFANTIQTRLNFSIDDSTEDVVVKIMDKETDEVVKQFPAEEILELRDKMQDLSGLLFSTNV